MSLVFYPGAIYRYYESRRRLYNDAQPSRQMKVKENKNNSQRRQAQRNVSANLCSQYLYWQCINSLNASFLAFQETKQVC